mgnify:CR=1 FL=1
MKNCPLCATEYYDEAKWCPDCEYDFPAGPPAPPPNIDDIWKAIEDLLEGSEHQGDPANAVAERIVDLYREADDNVNEIWKRSPEFLNSADEYDIASKLLPRWKKANKTAPE